MTRKIGIVTAGHLATCPRMLKAAEALVDAGYEVRVVATRSTAWAARADEELLERRAGRFRLTVVDYRRSASLATYLRTGVRQRIARSLTRLPGPPLAVAARAFARTHDELVKTAAATEAELLYGGTTGGLAATAEAARRLGVPYALDLEDFYSGQDEGGELEAKLARRIEDAVLDGAAFLTAGSTAIAEAYRVELGVSPVPIHNVFSLPEAPPDLDRPPGDALKLYWFSQMIGPGRGLEEAVTAAGLAGRPIELHLRGRPDASFVDALRRRAEAEAPKLRLHLHEPAPPDEMIRLALPYDAGLALERTAPPNRDLCVTNKVLTYPLAGLALVLTNTRGHRELLAEMGESAVVAPCGDVETLARGLARLATDRAFLRACREASYRAATRRWHWEHPEERGRLLRLVASALP